MSAAREAPARVWVISDDAFVSGLLVAALELARCSVTTLRCDERADRGHLVRPDLIVLDLDARRSDAPAFYRRLREQLAAPVIVVSGHCERLEAIDSDTGLALVKPFSIVSLMVLAERALGVDLDLPPMFRRASG